MKCQVQFPPAVLTALNNKDPALKSHSRNRLKNMLIQALFDYLSDNTMYVDNVEICLWLIHGQFFERNFFTETHGF